MTLQVNKTLEHSFDLGIALTATFLQINLQQLDVASVYLKLAVFAGAATYVFRAMKDDNLSNKDAVFAALTGYTFGVYMAPAIVDYFSIGKVGLISGIHYLSGAFGQWALNVGWAIMKGAYRDGWNAIRDRFFSSKRRINNDDNHYEQ
ncbi:hypothetical protein [Runella sp. SP2]|uniref:hypothetical protein n=1 Tax=Runella sp. SP2 TaxID=2268026 RepID=UPI000F07F903|nr:hypothetical protein [Runella sp. SP2]AYQ31372.1 hypothetical protein DTQ70_03905 [Runella sp. SP2]